MQKTDGKNEFEQSYAACQFLLFHSVGGDSHKFVGPCLGVLVQGCDSTPEVHCRPNENVTPLAMVLASRSKFCRWPSLPRKIFVVHMSNVIFT